MTLSSCFLALLPLALDAQTGDLISSSVADATEQIMGHRAHMSNEIRLLAGTRLAGPAVTLRLVRDHQASAMEAGLATVKFLEAAAPGSVVIAVLDDDKSFAVFGSTLAVFAKTRRLAGFVVDGSVRDLHDLRSLAFPIFARGSAPGSAGGHYRAEGMNVMVVCRAIT